MVKRFFIATLVAISPLYALAQGLITGHIKDARNGESLIGASVIVKSEKGQGVVTDVDGNFSLQTKKEAPLTLRVEYVGYRPLDVDVYDFEEPVEITLIDNSSRLDEVVIVGYGAQKRLELTSSISSVDENILKQQNASVESALQGAVAGLNVTTTSGQPGAASIIRIRGGNSITGGNEPLYVIDGFIVYNDVSSNKTGARGSDAALDPLAFLNPSDIESIEVLKDVSATAIYGTRGANGVIIITTKKGSHGKNNINYSATFGWSTISKKLDFLNAWQWADLWNEMYDNGEVGYRLDEPTESYDWQDAALQTGFSQEHQLRASIGVVGNQEIGDYQFAANVNPRTVIIDGQRATSYIISNKSNPDLKWETTSSYNIGLSTGFFHNRLTVTLDAYYKKTSDLLLNVPVEQVTGFDTVLRNVGSVTNKGVELEVGGVLIEKKDLRWNLNANIAHNKNEVTSLGNAEYFIPSHGYTNPLIVKVGEPLGSFYGYKFKGIIQLDEDLSQLPSQTISTVEPGNPKFEDVNGDGVVNEQDRVVLGNIQPKFTYGFNTKLTYKNWDLFVSASGSYGNKLFNELACRLDRGNGYYYNPLAEVANRWTPTNPSNTIQKASNATSIYTDDRFVEDASYLKIRNIQLGYTLPVPKLTKDARLKVYVSLQNFFTFTPYSGYDPEANRSGSDETSALYQGIDNGTYPTAKTVLVGFNVTL